MDLKEANIIKVEEQRYFIDYFTYPFHILYNYWYQTDNVYRDKYKLDLINPLNDFDVLSDFEDDFDEDDSELVQPSRWYNTKMSIIGVGNVFGEKQINYTENDLKELGYQNFIYNPVLSKNIDNIIMYGSMSHRYNILYQLFCEWNFKNIELEIVCPKYCDQKYMILANFLRDLNEELAIPKIKTNTIYLRDSDSKRYHQILESKKNMVVSKHLQEDLIRIVILDCMDFTFTQEEINTISNKWNQNYFIIMKNDQQLDNIKDNITKQESIELSKTYMPSYCEYSIIPSRKINKFYKMFKQQFPTIKDDEIYTIVSQSYLKGQNYYLNYIRAC